MMVGLIGEWTFRAGEHGEVVVQYELSSIRV